MCGATPSERIPTKLGTCVRLILVLGAGVGAALCASNGSAVGLSIGLALALAFGLRRRLEN